jgi:MFS family permease
MALRVVVASAVVSRKVGRGRNRLGAFLLRAYPRAVSRLLVLVSSIIFVDAMLFTALTPLVPEYAHEFDLSTFGAGILVGAFGAGAVLGGVPGGLGAARFGPKSAVVAGLALLAVASFAFALAGSAETLVAARFVQGFASTTTWAGALAWIAMETPKERRGAVLGTAFGAAVFGAVIGPVFGALADAVGVRASFMTVGVVALAFAALAAIPRSSRREAIAVAGVSRAFHDLRFVGGLWLNSLPAFLFGMLIVLSPLALADDGWSTLAIASVFFVMLSLEAVVNPFIGRLSDRAGPLLPTRVALAASVVVTAGLAAASGATAIAALVVVAGASFGGLYAPAISVTSHRADAVGLAQGLAFGIMNSAWALGALAGPVVGGAVEDALGGGIPYLLGTAACLLTLGATLRLAPRKAGAHAT